MSWNCQYKLLTNTLASQYHKLLEKRQVLKILGLFPHFTEKEIRAPSILFKWPTEGQLVIELGLEHKTPDP